MEINPKINELPKFSPWNSSENSVTINSIRYNQDLSLLILGTSKGYKIFSSTTFKSVEEENEIICNFGDIHVAELYYSSKIVFLLPSIYNQKYLSNEIIVFDDYFQKNVGSVKIKSINIENFYVGQNIISLVTKEKIIILDIYSLKIINIIEEIAFNDKILSFNSHNILAYIKASDRKTFYIENFKSKNSKVESKKTIKITTNFDFIQVMKFSPKGEQIAALSIFGNKLHIYHTSSGKLKNCIFLGPKIQTLDKIFFSEKKPNYLLFLKNDKTFNIYKIGKAKDKEQNQKCICNIDSDQDLVDRLRELDQKNAGLSKPRSLSKSKAIRDPHVYSDFKDRPLFADFDRNNHKDLLFIDINGKLFKYHFNKKRNGRIEPTLSVQWI